MSGRGEFLARHVCLLLLAVSISAASESLQELPRYKRLTAFGKSPSAASPAPPLQGKGRECKSQADCEVIQYTVCSVDPRDQRRRCICRDQTHPVNGQCVNKPRGLRQQCNNDAECLEGAECKVNPNATATASTASTKSKICLCRHGYTELEHACSGSDRLDTISSLLVGTFALLLTFRTLSI